MGMRILVLNRGEISKRIAIACLECGHTPIGVYAMGDVLPNVFKETIPLEGESIEETYLDVAKLLALCAEYKIDAIHPGYGFLSENPQFVQEIEKNKIIFIGPTSASIKKMGLKIESKIFAESLGVPVLPWAAYQDTGALEHIKKDAAKIGYPIIVKASAGGGGRGMRIVHDEKNLSESVQLCMTEAARNFKDGVVFIEKYIENPRHIEVQIVGDGKGEAIHIGTRECSVQRRYQKIVEEAPACGMPDKLISLMCKDSVNIAKQLEYKSLGTLEFIYDGTNYYFLEMNTRIQVEHTVTELVSQLDLVHMQLGLITQNFRLPSQSSIVLKGHAIEFRLCAESPEKGFLPSTGKLLKLHLPHFPNIRIDDGLVEGQEVKPEFDSMITKICSYGEKREIAKNRLLCYLNEIRVLGVDTNLSCVKQILASKEFQEFKIFTNWLDKQTFAGLDFDHKSVAKLFLASLEFNKRSDSANHGINVTSRERTKSSVFNGVRL